MGRKYSNIKMMKATFHSKYVTKLTPIYLAKKWVHLQE